MGLDAAKEMDFSACVKIMVKFCLLMKPYTWQHRTVPLFSKDSCGDSELSWEYLECLCLHRSLIGLEPVAIYFIANVADRFSENKICC